MTSFILQNFYCTLQVCADNQCHACHGWLHAPGQGTCLCMTYVRWVIALASAAHRAASTMVIHLLRTQSLPWRPSHTWAGCQLGSTSVGLQAPRAMAPDVLLDTNIENLVEMQVPGMLAQHRWKVAAVAAAAVLACVLHTLSVHL